MRYLRPLLVCGTAAAAVAAAILITNSRNDAGNAGFGAGSVGAAILEEAVVASLTDADATRVSVAVEVDATDGPWSSTDAARAHLAAMRAAFEVGDLEAGSRLVVQFFEGGGQAVDTMFSVIGDPLTGHPDAPALGILLKAASYYSVNDPSYLAPWTTDDIATFGLDLLGSGDHVPSVLCAGFDELGQTIAPEYLVQLLDIYNGRDLGPAMESQYPALLLAKTWARTMGPEVEGVLLESAGLAEVGDSNRAQAASMLLERDWRRFAPDLAAMLDEYETGGSLEGQDKKAFQYIVTSRIANLDTIDRAHYYATLADASDLAVGMAWQMNADDASLALSQPGMQDLPEFAVDLLKIRGGHADALNAGQRILAQEVPTVVEKLVVSSWLQSDLSVSDDFNALMEERFIARSSDPSRFWSTLGTRFSELEDYQVFAGVMPWITRSEGESDFHRDRLVAMVRDRFEGIEVN